MLRQCYALRLWTPHVVVGSWEVTTAKVVVSRQKPKD